ncbi:MAG: hypothetical protein MZW92_65880 [Comamonadaceae bacterium]|nr:hypothetical protein [Comamonadaceae bacterium]
MTSTKTLIAAALLGTASMFSFAQSPACRTGPGPGQVPRRRGRARAGSASAGRSHGGQAREDDQAREDAQAHQGRQDPQRCADRHADEVIVA